jgi:hypothetical protein
MDAGNTDAKKRCARILPKKAYNFRAASRNGKETKNKTVNKCFQNKLEALYRFS